MTHSKQTAVPETAQAIVARLATLHSLEYEQVREAEAQKLGIRVGALDKEIDKARRSRQKDDGKDAIFPFVDVWPEPVDGRILLNGILQALQRHIVCNIETAQAATLWIAFTWMVDHVEVAPLAIITAPEKGCGKSQLLDLIGRLSRRPLVASNISPAATFRVIEAYAPTLLIDEADAFFKENEELRGLINSGHTRQSAYVIRTVGDHHEPRQFSTWGAKAISGIGALPDTVMDRAIILKMRRRLPHEKTQRLRHTDPQTFDDLASRLARFAEDAGPSIARSRPQLPEFLSDRAQDNWEPLLAIADYAGGDWPRIARDTALIISGSEQNTPSLSTELLGDIKEIFEHNDNDRISSADLLKALCDDDLKPWATYNHGQAIRPRQLANRLKEFGIRPETIRTATGTPKGYMRICFEDTFARYLTATSVSLEKSATTPQSINNASETNCIPVVDDDALQITNATTQHTAQQIAG